MVFAGWYANFFEQGKVGCLKAIEAGLNLQIDKDNLKHYEEREKQEMQHTMQNMTKKQF